MAISDDWTSRSRGDLRRPDGAFTRDFGLADGAFSGDAGFFGFAFGSGFLAGDLSRLRRLHGLDFLLLRDARLLFVLLDLQFKAGRLHGRTTHRHVGVGIDLGAFLLGIGNDLGQLAHAYGVEGVVLIECRKTASGRVPSGKRIAAAGRSRPNHRLSGSALP